MPLVGDTVSHDWSDETLQAVFEVTFVVVWAAPPRVDQAGILTDKAGSGGTTPACVTGTYTVTGVVPACVVVNVNVADRGDVDGFADALIVTDRLPRPDVGETLNHVWSGNTLHDVLDVTSTLV